MPISEKTQHMIAASLGLSGSAFVELATQAARQQELMSKAMFITGRNQEEIRAAVARSPYSFAEFVDRLAAGRESVDPLHFVNEVK